MIQIAFYWLELPSIKPCLFIMKYVFNKGISSSIFFLVWWKCTLFFPYFFTPSTERGKVSTLLCLNWKFRSRDHNEYVGKSNKDLREFTFIHSIRCLNINLTFDKFPTSSSSRTSRLCIKNYMCYMVTTSFIRRKYYM